MCNKYRTMGFLNYIRGITKKAKNQINYRQRQGMRLGARAQGYASATNKYESLSKSAEETAKKLANSITLPPGMNINKARAELAGKRKAGWAAWRSSIKNKIKDTLTGSLRKTRNALSNVFAGKLGRSAEERNLNRAAYARNQASKAKGRISMAEQADIEAEHRNELRDEILGQLTWPSVSTRAKGAAAAAIATIKAFMEMPFVGKSVSLEALKELIKQIQEEGEELSEETLKALRELGITLNKTKQATQAEILKALESLKLSATLKEGLAKAFADLSAAIASGAAEVVDQVNKALSSLSALPPAAARKLGAAWAAMENMSQEMKDKLCGCNAIAASERAKSNAKRNANSAAGLRNLRGIVNANNWNAARNLAGKSAAKNGKKGGLTPYIPRPEPMDRRSRRNNRR